MTVLMVGTKRGLFLMTSEDRLQWEIVPTALGATAYGGGRIFFAALDQRGTTPRLFAADNGDFFGSFLRYSDDFGQTWHEPERGIQFPEESGKKLVNIWTVVPGRASQPGVVYAGVDPADLWISEDGGVTWDLNEALANHPTREQWNPGAGGLCLHTIIPDYADPTRMWLGISAVGCLRSEDGGHSWTFANKGTRADFQPEKYPEFGQCLHRMVQHPTQPEVLYQQNHCGVYKTANAGDEWEDLKANLPGDFGFPIALDPHHPDTFYVVVENEARANYGDQFTIYRTQNAGAEWEALTEGLPAGPGVRLGVLRHGMCNDSHDPCGVYVGTNTGQLFASADRGDSWRLIADYLPSIYSVTATVIE
jgi:hypothetical protein